MGKKGKYGTEATTRDEENSTECVNEIYQDLIINHPIKGYRYKLLKKIPERLYYERDGVNIPRKNDRRKEHCIIPDLPTILLISIENPQNFYVVLSGDDKYQETGGNAIERSLKNHRGVFEEKMCHNSDVCPYVIFCAGKAFFEDDGEEYNKYFISKWRQMLPYERDGNAHYFTGEEPYSSFKKHWNRLYFKKERFTKEEKMKILKDVVEESIAHYKASL